MLSFVVETAIWLTDFFQKRCDGGPPYECDGEAAMDEATAMRAKDAAAFATESGHLKANLAAGVTPPLALTCFYCIRPVCPRAHHCERCHLTRCQWCICRGASCGCDNVLGMPHLKNASHWKTSSDPKKLHSPALEALRACGVDRFL